MKRFMNYIIFHIYNFQKKVGNEDIANFSISTIITLLVCFLVNIINTILFVYFDYEIIKLSIFKIILIMFIIFIPIYFYIRKEHYKEYNFSESKKGYSYFFFLIVVIFSITVYFAKKSRYKIMINQGYTKEQILNDGKKKFDPNEKPKSLEGEIRLWYYNTFEKK